MDSANAFSSLHSSLYPGWKKTNKEDRQADATAAGEQTHSSQKKIVRPHKHAQVRTQSLRHFLKGKEKKQAKVKL